MPTSAGGLAEEMKCALNQRQQYGNVFVGNLKRLRILKLDSLPIVEIESQRAGLVGQTRDSYGEDASGDSGVGCFIIKVRSQQNER